MPFIQDVRHALRLFIRQPAFALTAVLALALGIGANTAVFSVVYSVLLKPYPFPDSRALIFVYDSYAVAPNAPMSHAKYIALRDGNRTLAGIGAMTQAAITLTDGEPEQVFASRVSAEYLQVLGMPAARGRWFSPDEDRAGAPPVILLSHALWTRRFASAPDIVGRTINVDGQPRTVVGVMPRDFGVLSLAEAWLPLSVDPANASVSNLRLIGRLKDGARIEQASQDLAALSASFNQATGADRAVVVRPLLDMAVSDDRARLLMLQATVVFVLLVACANVANLLLARSVTRQREFAIRSALGAGRSRIVRQLLTESTVLAVAGAAAGMLLAGWLVRLFVSLAPPTFVRRGFIAIDGTVLMATGVAAVVTGLVFGLAPALRARRLNPNEALQSVGGRASTGSHVRAASRLLVVAEMTMALTLVVGAGLLLKGLVQLQRVDPGFEAAGVMTFELSLPARRYAEERVRDFYAALLNDVRSLPGVAEVGAISALPLAPFGGGSTPVRVDGEAAAPANRPLAQLRSVAPGYFETLRVPIVRGQAIGTTHSAGDSPVVVINRRMAELLFAGRDPLGQRVLIGSGPAARWREVIGIAGDVRSAGLDDPAPMQAFVPHAQLPVASMAVAFRTAGGDPAALMPVIARRVHALDKALPLIRPRSMGDIVDAALGNSRLAAVLMGVFALLAATLAVVGIYSLMSYSVAQRVREIGIRVAIGATRGAVLRMVLGEGLLLAAAGVILGTAGGLVLARSLGSMLYGVSPVDPQILVSSACGVLVVAAAACYIPARRALRIDPIVALRAD